MGIENGSCSELENNRMVYNKYLVRVTHLRAASVIFWTYRPSIYAALIFQASTNNLPSMKEASAFVFYLWLSGLQSVANFYTIERT